MENEFTLKGGVEEDETNPGIWRAEVKLTTPDGKTSTLDSGFVYQSQAEAERGLQWNIDRILSSFTKNGVEVVSKNGKAYS